MLLFIVAVEVSQWKIYNLKYCFLRIIFSSQAISKMSTFVDKRNITDELRSRIDDQGMKILLSASCQGTKITKKQAELDVRSLVDALVNVSGLKRPRMTLERFMGSIAIFASMVKGLCYVFDRRVEILVHDCEIIVVRKTESPPGLALAPRPSTSAKRRLSTGGSTRRASLVTSITEPVDFEAIMDLDSLCTDLNRRPSVTGPQLTPIVARGKKSRSGSSSVSEEEHANAFEAADIPFEEVDLTVAPLAGLPEIPDPPTPQRQPRRLQPKKGFNPKISMTPVEWATMLRAEKITNRYFSMGPADYARENVDLFKHRRKEEADDFISVAEAVDELRGGDDDDNMMLQDDDIVPVRNGRPSLASSFAETERRQSIGSDVFLDSDYKRRPSLVGEADELKLEIKKALSARHAKRGTLIAFDDIAPVGSRLTTRKIAANVFMQLLVLSTRNEIRFTKTPHNFTSDPLFGLVGEVSSSSSDDC